MDGLHANDALLGGRGSQLRLLQFSGQPSERAHIVSVAHCIHRGDIRGGKAEYIKQTGEGSSGRGEDWQKRHKRDFFAR